MNDKPKKPARPFDAAWVIAARVPDTRRVLAIAKQADRGLRTLRNGMIIRWPAEEVLPLLAEYEAATVALHEVTVKVLKKTGIPYKPPRNLPAAAVEEKTKK
ncbi:MAG: hypothetical protein ACNS63_04480 [Candidatus Nitrospinota bacterium M3_3B_026]